MLWCIARLFSRNRSQKQEYQNKKPTLHTHLADLHSWVTDLTVFPWGIFTVFNRLLWCLGCVSVCRVQFKHDSFVLHFIITTPLRSTPTFLGVMCIKASVWRKTISLASGLLNQTNFSWVIVTQAYSIPQWHAVEIYFKLWSPLKFGSCCGIPLNVTVEKASLICECQSLMSGCKS